MAELALRPPYVPRDDVDPRFYDLRPRPTTRRAPTGWTPEGARRHRRSTLRTLAFLQGLGLGRGDRRTERAELALRMQALTSELLDDPDTAAAATEPFPRLVRFREETG